MSPAPRTGLPYVSRWGEVEEVNIPHQRLLLREEGGHEVTLAVEPALRLIFELGLGGITKVNGGDGLVPP